MRGGAVAQRAPGVAVFGDLEPVLSDPDIDAVIVATPPTPTMRSSSARSRPASTCSSRSRWRPPGRRAGADRDRAREDLVLMPGHTFVFSPSVNKVRDLITEGDIGESTS